MSVAASDSLPLVAVVMGSKSDCEVMKECAAILKQFHSATGSRCRPRWRRMMLQYGRNPAA
jgi:phosphoribosylcarboxyaminoimidazole (NCAIR) mutase